MPGTTGTIVNRIDNITLLRNFTFFKWKIIFMQYTLITISISLSFPRSSPTSHLQMPRLLSLSLEKQANETNENKTK